MENLTKQEATDFFALFYNGAHHIPGFEPKPFGQGWVVEHDRGGLATYDFQDLTKLVILAHDNCIRVEVMPSSKRNTLKIAIWKRDPNGEDMSTRHPKLEDAIVQVREFLQTKKNQLHGN